MQKYTIVNVIDLCVRDVTCIFSPIVYIIITVQCLLSLSLPLSFGGHLSIL